MNEPLNEPLGAAILRRVFKEYFQSDWAALFVLRQAAKAGVEPFRYCAVEFSLTESEIYRRAAKVLGLAYTQEIQADRCTNIFVDHVEQLKNARSLRGHLLDREVLFVAPDFWRFVELAKRISYKPELREKLCVVAPKTLLNTLTHLQSTPIYDSAITRLAKVWPFASAHLGLSKWVRYSFLAIVFGVALSVFFPWGWFQPIATFALTVLFLVPAAFRLSCALNGRTVPRIPVQNLVADDQLPIYSILIPLRDEAILVEQLVKAIKKLNYPPEKLDVKFVVEATSKETIAAVQAFTDDIQFELIPVPDSEPRTKPKAVNFALPFVRGEHVVIFDAEDIPEPNQLRIAATVFAKNAQLECLQAELVIDNANENALTALFATEYAAQFGLIMPALAYFNMPMPLGGTSNHFRTETLKRIGAWDSFNVTEDADLGIRLSRWKLKSAVLPSYTREEAPISLWPWVKQRTRWMKGWMQTLLVHSQDYKAMVAQMGWRNALIFYIYVGGLIFSAPLHGLFVAQFLYDLFTQKGVIANQYFQLNMHMLVLISGYLSAMCTAFLGLWHTRQLHLFGWQIFLPFYWLLTSFATLRAAIQLATKPFSWEKTAHARTQLPRFDAKKMQNQKQTSNNTARPTSPELK
ncbi:glycosyltransferase [Maritalea sp.]|uniref:glycosyltransferase n=1 Tax=Maritalea sp. TaxID=2003361 RepID=UPI003EF8A2A0